MLSSIKKGAGTFLNLVDRLQTYSSWVEQGRAPSLVSQSAPARFEPLTIIDSDVANYEGIVDVLEGVQHLFAGYLLQVLGMNFEVNGRTFSKRLEALRPENYKRLSTFDVILDVASKIATEDHKTNIGKLPRLDTNFSIESFKEAKRSASYREATAQLNISNESSTDGDTLTKKIMSPGTHTPSKTSELLNRSASLSIGRFYDVQVNIPATVGGGESGINSINIPVSIRLISLIVPSRRLSKLFTLEATMETSFKERYYAWRSGKISSFLDFILARDLIREERKNIIEDTDGLYSQIVDKKNYDSIKGALNKRNSFSAVTNIAVISSETAAMMEKELNMKFNNFNSRQVLFGGTAQKPIMDAAALMFLVIIDKFADKVTIYTDSIEHPSTWTLREFKQANAKSEVNISEILKAYQLGSQPSSF